MDQRLQLVDVIRGVRNRWRMRLAARGAVVVVAGTLLALLLSAVGPRVLPLQPGRDHRVPRSGARRLPRARASGVRAAAAQAGQRRAGRDVPRGMRPDARSRDSSARSKPARRPTTRRIRRGWSKSSSSRRSTSAGRSSTAPRSIAPAMKRHVAHAGGVAAAAALIVALGPAYPAPGHVGAPDLSTKRRSVEPLQHR